MTPEANGPFPIIDIDPASRSDIEQLGSKPKFWFKRDGENWLFKEARENTGEDWAEKVASEIAHLLGLPSHHADLAVWQGKRGCAVKSFLTSNHCVLIHGNELLGGFISGYDKEKQWRQADHTFENIVHVIENLFRRETARRAAAARMVGYLMFDALVGNTDRHHQNWGVVLERKPESISLNLAPTFDHASSLGRELTDETRSRHLEEGTVNRYILRARGGIFEHSAATKGMSPIELARRLATTYPEFTKPWQARIRDLPQTAFGELLNRIPDERISATGREFALAFLLASRKMIQEIS
jgi:hypothetical protein